MPHDADKLLTAALRSLDALADAGDARARFAAAVLRGQRSPGRPAVDDAGALAEVARLTAAGRRRDAIGAVARKLARDPAEAVAIGRRLRRKINGRNYIRPSPSDG